MKRANQNKERKKRITEDVVVDAYNGHRPRLARRSINDFLAPC